MGQLQQQVVKCGRFVAKQRDQPLVLFACERDPHALQPVATLEISLARQQVGLAQQPACLRAEAGVKKVFGQPHARAAHDGRGQAVAALGVALGGQVFQVNPHRI